MLDERRAEVGDVPNTATNPGASLEAVRDSNSTSVSSTSGNSAVK
jgi:hypothetical protein